MNYLLNLADTILGNKRWNSLSMEGVFTFLMSHSLINLNYLYIGTHFIFSSNLVPVLSQIILVTAVEAIYVCIRYAPYH